MTNDTHSPSYSVHGPRNVWDKVNAMYKDGWRKGTTGERHSLYLGGEYTRVFVLRIQVGSYAVYIENERVSVVSTGSARLRNALELAETLYARSQN